MPTPDFEDWLARQDIPVEETTTVDSYKQYLLEELGIHGGSLDVAGRIYTERYKGLEEYDIRAVERHYLYMGEEFVETRYAIKGEPGMWGKFRAYEFAVERASAAGDYEVAETMSARYKEMGQEPERRQVRWRE